MPCLAVGNRSVQSALAGCIAYQPFSCHAKLLFHIIAFDTPPIPFNMKWNRENNIQIPPAAVKCCTMSFSPNLNMVWNIQVSATMIWCRIYYFYRVTAIILKARQISNLFAAHHLNLFKFTFYFQFHTAIPL